MSDNVVSDNVLPYRSPKVLAVTSAWRTYVGAEGHWADSVFQLALAINDMRDEYEADQEFGRQFDTLDLRRLDGTPIGRDDRQALVNIGKYGKMGKYRDLIQQVLRQTGRRSFQFIWREEIAPQVSSEPESDPVTLRNVTDEQNENENPKEWTNSQKVTRLREIQKEHPDWSVAARATAAGFSGSVTSARGELVVDRGVPELVEAVDDGRVSLSPAADQIVRTGSGINKPAVQRKLLEQFLAKKAARGPAVTKSKPNSSTAPRPASSAKGSPPLKSTPAARPVVVVSNARTIAEPVRHVPAMGNLSGVGQLTAELAGLPPDATTLERARFHQIHGMDPAQTIAGRYLSQTSTELMSISTMLSRVEAEFKTLPPGDELARWIDRLMAHVPRSEIGHGEELDYAERAQKYMVSIRGKLSFLSGVIEAYRDIIDKRVTSE